MRALLTVGLLLGLALPPRLAAAADDVNACGCYREPNGECKCNAHKAKCVCPGDCEPVSCAAKREKDASKEAAATLARINAREKKKAAENARSARSKAKLKPAKATEPAPQLPQ
jgi:hypothetical protein